jgi:hypothetical protein
VFPYLLLSRQDSAHRQHDLCAVFNGIRYLSWTGVSGGSCPSSPPWPAIFQQMQRSVRFGCFERWVEATRILLREFAGRKGQLTAECSRRRRAARGPGMKARNGAENRRVHIAVDTLGHLLALSVTPAGQGDRAQV